MAEQHNTYCFHIKLYDNRDDMDYRGVTLDETTSVS